MSSYITYITYPTYITYLFTPPQKTYRKKTPPESSGGVCKATEAAPHPNLYLYYPK